MIKNNGENGNVLLYILIAVALMAALAFAISRDGGGQQAERMDDVRADLLATELIQHVASAEQVIYNMTQWGADYSDLKFDLPGSTDFNTDVTNQVYHPQGGGLQVSSYGDEIFEGGSRGWNWQNLTNVSWSPSTQTDLIYTFIDIKQAVCEKLNQKLHKNTNIPLLNNGFTGVFMYDTSTNNNFLSTDCPDCVGNKSMCLRNSANRYAFYTIIGSR